MAQLRDLLVNGSARVVGDLYANLSGNVLNFGTCTTAAGTPEKSITTKGSFELIDGSKILVLFTNTNTANSPTLNVNNTGAKPIFVDDTNGINKSFLTAQQYYWFVYNEAKDHWRVAGGGTTQITSIQYGGTNNDSFTSNRPLFFNGTKIIGSTDNYINDTSLGINTTSLTSGYNFEVNGKSLFHNSVVIAATTDISGTAANAAPLIIGNQTGQHLEFDGNEIISKSNGTTVAKLNIQTDGGYTQIGKDGLGINGSDTSYKLYVNGTSLFKGDVTHNGIVYFANGTDYYVNNSADGNLRDVSVNTIGISSISGSGLGISLYGGPNPNGFADYGISYAQVADGGSFGDITNDNSNSRWATYFTIAKTLDNDDKEVRKGWIWRGDNADTATTMAASLSNRGVFTARAITAPTNYIAFPQNETFSYANDKTGILIIQLPQTKTNTCIRFDVQIYSYEGSKKSLATYHIGGCNANNAEGWKDLQAYSTGDGILSNLNVRFGLDANENAIITIGEITTNWSSPKVAITNLIVGNNNSGADNEAIDKWSYGWVVNISDSNPMASTAESITSPKDDVLYSGMNLLPNTQYMDGWSGDNYTENLPINYCRGKRLNIGSTSLSNNISISYNNAFEPEPNTWYTLSFWAKANKNIKLYSYFESAVVAEGYNSSMYIIDNLNNGQIANDITNTWQRYWICWKTNSSTSGYKNITILQLLGTQVNTNVIVILPKLEKGRIPSDWTRNPGDAVHLYGMTGDSSYLQSGGGYNLGYNNLVLHGGLEGISGIAFLSQSGNLSIDSPSDRAFIQYHAKGVSVGGAENVDPTENVANNNATFVIGVGNEAEDQLWLQTVGTNGIKHQIGENSYTIADTHNTNWDPTKTGGWSTGTLNNGPTLSLVLGDVVKETASIPAATDLNSGVITAVAQRIGGDKTFTGSLLAANNSSKDIGAVASTWRNVYATTYFGSLQYSLTLERNSENPVSFSNSANVSYNVGSVVQDLTGAAAGGGSTLNADTFAGMTKQQWLNTVYPIGSIYTSVNSTSPETLFGGTWEALGGRFLIGANEDYMANSTGGSTEHTHTIEHTHTVAHSHSMTHTHTMAHTHPQVATTSGGPSNNTSGGTALTIAQMPSHTHSFSATSGGAGGHTHDVSIIAKGWSGWQDAANYWASYYSFTAWYNPPTIDTSADARADRSLVKTGTTSNPGNHTHSISGTTGRQGSGSAHTHTLSSHTHTTAATTTGGASNATTSTPNNTNTGESTPTTSAASNETSGSTSTLPPYLVVYMWKRTA